MPQRHSPTPSDGLKSARLCQRAQAFRAPRRATRALTRIFHSLRGGVQSIAGPLLLRDAAHDDAMDGSRRPRRRAGVRPGSSQRARTQKSLAAQTHPTSVEMVGESPALIDSKPRAPIPQTHPSCSTYRRDRLAHPQATSLACRARVGADPRPDRRSGAPHRRRSARALLSDTARRGVAPSRRAIAAIRVHEFRRERAERAGAAPRIGPGFRRALSPTPLVYLHP